MTIKNRLKFITKLLEKSKKTYQEAKLLFDDGFYEAKLSESFKERQVSDYTFEASPSRSDAKRILNNAQQFSAEVVPYLHVWMEENKD